MSEENIQNIIKSGSNFAPTIVDHHLLPEINFNGHCSINNTNISKKLVNLYISYTYHKYKNSGYDKGFDSRSEFSLPDDSMGNMSLFLELI